MFRHAMGVCPYTNQIHAVRKSVPLISAWFSAFSSKHHYNLAPPHPSRGVSSDADTPSQAQIVVAGGGVIGCSVAYHLAKLGWKDIVLVEQGSLSCGTTWHAAGLLSILRGTESETRISSYASKLYSQLEQETGLETGIKKCGGLLLARTSDRLTAIKRLLVQARSYGIEVESISPREAHEMWPFMRIDDLKGALWLPDEGVISPSDICRTLARGAVNQGVRILEKTQIHKVLTDGAEVQGVQTNKGKINCQIFVNCCGLWAREVGLKSDPVVNIPLHPVEHFYILTKPLGASHMLPMMRDPDGSVYFREWGGGLCAGGMEPVVKPCFTDKTPENFEFQLFPEDWNQFEVLMNEIIHRVPVLEKTEILQLINGPESFTPDGKSILGEAPNVRQYFVAAGVCTMGISNAAGIGDLMSRWITDGQPSMDVSRLDIKRFAPHHNNKRYLHDRVKGVVALLYSMPFPRKEIEFARKMKSSVLYPLLDGAGASWGDRMGWETPNWFALSPENRRTNQGTFGTPHWFKNVEEECKAYRDAVAVVDLTSSSLFELKSKSESGCLDVLQSLCVNDMDIPIGDVVHTSMLNNNGGYEVLCTVIRPDVNRFLVVTKPSLTTRTQSWILRNIPTETSDVNITNIQSNCTILGILGPRSRDLLQALTLTSLSEANFPLESSQVLELDYASDVTCVSASEISGVGQGWLLFVSNHQAATLYNGLMSAGEEFGARNIGWYALDSVRVGRGSPMVGDELTPCITPYDIGMESTIDFSKTFIGKQALTNLQDKLSTKRLIHMNMKHYDAENLPWGGETVVYNGDVIGEVTSTTFNFTHGHPVCLGFIEKDVQNFNEILLKNTQLEVNIAGTLYPVELIGN